MGSENALDRFYQGPTPVYGLGFFTRTGHVINFYAHSLYWLSRYVGSVKVLAEVLKDGDPLLYGEMTLANLDRLAAEGSLIHLRRHAWGVSWPFKGQKTGSDDDFSGFPAWRDRLLAEARCYQSDIQDFPETGLPPWRS